jgi:hypothetical protein
MPVENAEDLAALFSPEDFGEAMVAHMPDSSAPFFGIQTTGHLAERPGSTADISSMVPRILARRQALPGLAQDDEIELPGGKRVVVNDVHYKGELIVIHYHEHW